MSKSAGEFDNIYMGDDAEILRKKIMKAVTSVVDQPSEIGSAKPAAVQNLFDLMKLVTDPTIIDQFESSYYEGNIRFGDMKKQLADDMELFIAPFRERIESTINDDAFLSKVAKQGVEKAQESSLKTIREVREIIGFRKFY